MSEVQRCISHYKRLYELCREAKIPNSSLKKLPGQKDILSRALVSEKHKIDSINPFIFVFPDFSISKKMNSISFAGLNGSMLLEEDKIIDNERTPDIPYVLFFPKKVMSVKASCASTLTLRETIALYMQEPGLINKGGATILGSYFKDGKKSSKLSLVRCEEHGPRLSINMPENGIMKRPSFCTPIARMVA